MCAGSVPDALPQYTQILVCFRAGAAAAPDVWFDNVSDIVDEETLPSYSSLNLVFFFLKLREALGWVDLFCSEDESQLVRAPLISLVL